MINVSFLNWFVQFVIIKSTEFTCFIFKALMCFCFVLFCFVTVNFFCFVLFCFVLLLCQFWQDGGYASHILLLIRFWVRVTTGEISRCGRQERNRTTSTLQAKLPHIVIDWLLHFSDVGQPCPHPSTSHRISSLCFQSSGPGVCATMAWRAESSSMGTYVVGGRQGFQCVFVVSWFSL